MTHCCNSLQQKYSRIAIADRFSNREKPMNDMLGSWMQHGLSQHAAETEASIAMSVH